MISRPYHISMVDVQNHIDHMMELSVQYPRDHPLLDIWPFPYLFFVGAENVRQYYNYELIDCSGSLWVHIYLEQRLVLMVSFGIDGPQMPMLSYLQW